MRGRETRTIASLRQREEHVSDPILRMKEIVKEFTGVRALDGVSSTCERGQVHGICGENGAGKSTLMKVLSASIPTDTSRARSSSTAHRRPSGRSTTARPRES